MAQLIEARDLAGTEARAYDLACKRREDETGLGTGRGIVAAVGINAHLAHTAQPGEGAPRERADARWSQDGL